MCRENNRSLEMQIDVVDDLRQPEYTGENRCEPCTVLNLVIAAVLGSVIARKSRLGGLPRRRYFGGIDLSSGIPRPRNAGAHQAISPARSPALVRQGTRTGRSQRSRRRRPRGRHRGRDQFQRGRALDTDDAGATAGESTAPEEEPAPSISRRCSSSTISSSPVTIGTTLSHRRLRGGLVRRDRRPRRVGHRRRGGRRRVRIRRRSRRVRTQRTGRVLVAALSVRCRGSLALAGRLAGRYRGEPRPRAVGSRLGYLPPRREAKCSTASGCSSRPVRPAATCGWARRSSNPAVRHTRSSRSPARRPANGSSNSASPTSTPDPSLVRFRSSRVTLADDPCRRFFRTGCRPPTTMETISFGTDGWRATLEEFTAPRVRMVGQAVAALSNRRGDSGAGRDRVRPGRPRAGSPRSCRECCVRTGSTCCSPTGIGRRRSSPTRSSTATLRVGWSLRPRTTRRSTTASSSFRGRRAGPARRHRRHRGATRRARVAPRGRTRDGTRGRLRRTSRRRRPQAGRVDHWYH